MTSVIKATKTLAAIEAAMQADQGAAYRVWLGRVLPHIGDAYRGEEDGFRTHLGGSLLGRKCARELWYGFHWWKKSKHSGKTLRLFNRGHLEEGRFIALLLMIGCKVVQQDEQGNQLRITHAGGHVGGSLDGSLYGCPDLPDGYICLTEFKTHGEKSFRKLEAEGVRSAKFEHFVQMQIYMKKRGYGAALYLAVNKNTDELYGEVIPLDSHIADEYLKRGERIVYSDKAPQRISKTPGWYECTFCDFKDNCFKGEYPDKNCRTCHYSVVCPNGTWMCMFAFNEEVLPKEKQLIGCEHYRPLMTE